jgi:uncharacterized membrane protein YfcA
LTTATLLLFLATGLAAGIVGGLLGLGGGIVLIPALRFGAGLSPSLAAGTTIVAVFFTTLGGTIRHHRNDHIQWAPIAPIIATGALATLLFSLLFPMLAQEERWLDLGVGLVFAMVALRMVLEGLAGARLFRSRNTVPPGPGSLPSKLGIGTVAGVLPGLLGIGTGAVLVPAFRLLLHWPIKVAMGSSLACFAVNALISSVLKGTQGYVDLSIALPASLGTFLGAILGAALNRRFPSRLLHLLFGFVFVYVSLKFILAFFGTRI